PISCHYFAAEDSPLEYPVIALDGDRSGPINNLAVMSDVASGYAPPGAALIAAAVLDPVTPVAEVRGQLTAWFGPVAGDWQLLRSYVIPHAQPVPAAPFTAALPARFSPGVYLAGDHRATPSINGALLAGRRAATAVLEDLD
ncbi:MAG: FAD-dependent oxidoreductase, partial [Acidimicrobiia bacterium]|nr:FAD-dependent oxidoreductase [Acidimicrobiia bacterium]